MTTIHTITWNALIAAKSVVSIGLLVGIPLLLLVLVGCVPSTKEVWNDVRAEFEKDYPGATVKLVVPAGGWNEHSVVIHFSRKGSTQEEYVTWRCEFKDGTWVVVDKNAQ